MSILRNLFDNEGTDKGEYAKTYEVLLGNRRNSVTEMLEIGIGTLIPGGSSMKGEVNDTYRPGGSLRAWKKYFPNANIYGIDIQPDTQFKEDRIFTFLCDSTDKRIVKETFSKLPSKFDVIIDDGCHNSEDQLASLKNFWPTLAEEGLYFIEDISQSSTLFTNPEQVKSVIGESNYFSVIDGESSIVRKLTILEKILLRLAQQTINFVPGVTIASKKEQWTIIVIKKTKQELII